MQHPTALLGSPQIGFFSLIGIVGSWIGSEIANTMQIAKRGSVAHFMAALAGSVIVIYAWRAIQGRPRGIFR